MGRGRKPMNCEFIDAVNEQNDNIQIKNVKEVIYPRGNF
jgi:hypothetical protein